MKPDMKVTLAIELILKIIFRCEELHVLPRAGGLLDQDALFIYLYEMYMQAKVARMELDNKKMASKMPK